MRVHTGEIAAEQARNQTPLQVSFWCLAKIDQSKRRKKVVHASDFKYLISWHAFGVAAQGPFHKRYTAKSHSSLRLFALDWSQRPCVF
jgi:hypothetical protein